MSQRATVTNPGTAGNVDDATRPVLVGADRVSG